MNWHVLLLRPLADLSGYRRRAAMHLLRGHVRDLDRFAAILDALDSDLGATIDPRIASEFKQAATCRGLLEEFSQLIAAMRAVALLRMLAPCPMEAPTAEVLEAEEAADTAL